MNLHQVLTGAANQGDYCLSVGSVDGSHFTAYAAGCNIVVLDGRFHRVQVISGSAHGLKSEISCIVCCRELGKIAASCEARLYIFEPVPVVRSEQKLTLNYQWCQSSVLTMEASIVIMAWNYYGSRLLTSLTNGSLQMWEEPEDAHQSPFDLNKSMSSPTSTPEFFIGDAGGADAKATSDCINADWVCSWQSVLSNPVVKVKFSSDGLFFVTCGDNDKLVKIWYENLKASSLEPGNTAHTDLSFSSIFIAHPKAVTGFSWRRSSKYIQKGCIANMLLTTCQDAICRIWSETFLPEDPLTDAMYSFDSSSTTNVSASSKSSFFSHFRDRHRHHRDNHRGQKHRFLHRLTHIRKMLHSKKGRGGKNKNVSSSDAHSSHSDLHASQPHFHPSDPSHPDFHDSFRHILADVHFHLAASIDFSTDIPMRGSFEDGAWPTSFVTHWLNNKEFQTNSSVESILASLPYKPSPNHPSSSSDNHQPPTHPSSHPSSSIHSPTSPQGSSDSSFQSPANATETSDKHAKTDRPTKRQTDTDVSGSSNNDPSSHPPSKTTMSNNAEQSAESIEAEEYDDHMDHLIHQWNDASDVLFSIHPADGSLLVWTIHYLDEAGPGMYRQPQVSFNSRLPRAFPAYDAATMHTAPRLYYESMSGEHQLNALKSLNQYDPPPCPEDINNLDSHVNKTSASSAPTAPATPLKAPTAHETLTSPAPRVLLLSKHTNGSLNLWNLSFSSSSNFSNAISVTHLRRICGHRFHAIASTCHPILPLLLSTSHFGEVFEL